MKNVFLAFVLVHAASIYAQDSSSIDPNKFFGSHKGAMVIFNQSTGKYLRINEKRSKERFLPASTFKILNSLIGLETGVITDENYVIKWDGIKRPVEEWNRDHTLATAIKYSVVPYYQELARRVGRQKYREYLNKIHYGNGKLGKQIDAFWLDNSLKISAEEQVEFLKTFYNYKLPFSKRSIDLVKQIIPVEKVNGSVMKFKTGVGTKEDETYIGWIVGYFEEEKNVYFYAFNIDAKTIDEVKKLRDIIFREILKQLKLIQ